MSDLWYVFTHHSSLITHYSLLITFLDARLLSKRMNPIIMKFGGTSVEGATAFQTAARIVAERKAQRPVVVVSAMAGFTDALLNCVKATEQQAGDDATATLEKHFDRHLRV